MNNHKEIWSWMFKIVLKKENDFYFPRKRPVSWECQSSPNLYLNNREEFSFCSVLLLYSHIDLLLWLFCLEMASRTTKGIKLVNSQNLAKTWRITFFLCRIQHSVLKQDHNSWAYWLQHRHLRLQVCERNIELFQGHQEPKSLSVYGCSFACCSWT